MTNKFVRQIPNIITSMRIVAAIFLLLPIFPNLKVDNASRWWPFILVYGLCGITDVLDGFLARKLHVESKLGSLLDSIADWLFYVSLAVRLFPLLFVILNWWHWSIIIVALSLHLIAYIICAIKFKKFSAVHTYANKLQSFLIFFFPFMIWFSLLADNNLIYSLYVFIGGAFCLYSAIEINLIHLIAKEYNENNKSIFLLKRNNKKLEEQKEEKM